MLAAVVVGRNDGRALGLKLLDLTSLRVVVFVRKPTVKVSCSNASPVHSSLRRIELMVATDQILFLRGVGMPSAVRFAAIVLGECPSRYSRWIPARSCLFFIDGEVAVLTFDVAEQGRMGHHDFVFCKSLTVPPSDALAAGAGFLFGGRAHDGDEQFTSGSRVQVYSLTNWTSTPAPFNAHTVVSESTVLRANRYTLSVTIRSIPPTGASPTIVWKPWRCLVEDPPMPSSAYMPTTPSRRGLECRRVQ